MLLLKLQTSLCPRNTGMISSIAAPSAIPVELSRIVAAAVQIHEAALSVEKEEDQFVASRRLQGPLLVATTSLDQEQDQFLQHRHHTVMMIVGCAGG
jgi:hypothetical protein